MCGWIHFRFHSFGSGRRLIIAGGDRPDTARPRGPEGWTLYRCIRRAEPAILVGLPWDNYLNMDIHEGRRRNLDTAYSRCSSDFVAYLDESFRGPAEHEGEDPFYLMTAVVIQKRDMEPVRKELVEIANGTYWHTTEAFQTETGAKQVISMLQYLADGDEPVVVALRRGFDDKVRTLEEARALCLTKLASTLSAPEFESRTDLLVLEERRNRDLKGLDEKTIKAARSSGAVPRNLVFHQTSPSCERLLWLPDLVSFSLRREVANGEKRLMDVIRPMTEIIDL